MNIKDLIDDLQGHTIVAQSSSERMLGSFGNYFVAWNGACTYRIYHIYNGGNSVEEVDVWTTDKEFSSSNSEQRQTYAQEYLTKWMVRS